MSYIEIIGITQEFIRIAKEFVGNYYGLRKELLCVCYEDCYGVLVAGPELTSAWTFAGCYVFSYFLATSGYLGRAKGAIRAKEGFVRIPL